MKKTLLFTVSMILMGAGAFLTAQEVQVVNEEETTAADSNSTEQIDLADITTVVNTAALVAGADALPDFADVVATQEGSGTIIPKLPELDGTDSSEAEVVTKKTAENSIYAEGKIGGGYPLGMYGEFKVYRLNEKSPFEFSFLHDSAAGYSRTNLSDGYNDSTTSIGIEKAYVFDKVNLDLGLGVVNYRNGLQNKVSSISDINQNVLDANAKVDWYFKKGFDFGGALGFDLSDRYLDITNSNVVIESWAKESWTLGMNPTVFFAWENNGFNVDVDATYKFDKETDFVHRFNTGVGFSWKNDVVKLYTDVDAVFGSHLNGNVIAVPFDAGVSVNFPVKFATRQVGLNFVGGMKSYRDTQSELETKYKFTGLNVSAQESSDWFGCFEFSVPVKSSLVFGGKIEYYHTAFGNGVLEPVYTGTVTNGLYSFQNVNRQNLVTDFNVNFTYGIFGFAAQWHSNWIYVPALESPNEIDLSLTVQSKDAKWSSTLRTEFYISDTGFDIPLINIDGLAKITDSVSVAVSVEDIVNLFGGQPRTYAGQYISRSGSVTAMFKFFF